MKSLRLFYTLIAVISLALAGFFYAKYYLKGAESQQYQELSKISAQALARTNSQLIQNKEALNKSLKSLAAMGKAIEALEGEASTFKTELEAFQREKVLLNIRIAELVEAKTVLEKKFYSLKELKKAIKTVRIRDRKEKKLQKIKQRLIAIEMLKAMDALTLAQGNKGYVIKEGQTTFRAAKIRVELEPIGQLSYSEKE